MFDTDRSKALLEVFRQGLCYFDAIQTNIMLGDRLSYLGMSDIARYSECPRQAVFSRLNLKNDSLDKQFVLQRGYWFETGVGQVLGNLGLNIFSQLEIDCSLNDVPVKAHLDFTLVWEKPSLAVRILEVKSMSQIPELPYSSHEFQVTGQTALLKELWNKPVFTLRDSKGAILERKQTFSELCKKHLGLSLPDNPDEVSIEGWLLYLSMKSVQPFGPYVHSTEMLQNIENYARQFWKQIQKARADNQSLKNIPYAQGFYRLCPYCAANEDCPKYRDGDFQPQWEPAIAKLDNLKKDKALLENEIKEIETALKLACRKSGDEDWINTDGHRFRLTTVKGRKSLDKELLRQQLSDLFDGMGVEGMDVDEFIHSCEKESEPGTRLYINPVN